MVAIDVEDEQVRIEGVEVIFGGADEQLRGEAANSAVFDSKVGVGKLFFYVVSDLFSPFLLGDGLAIEEDFDGAAVFFCACGKERHCSLDFYAELGVIERRRRRGI